ncbi:hypothetical protein HWN78_26370, partial [Escherichia coli]|uniref:hypothetical protein n=1 Tax=Escherichia coli TaxID=562 RepID=UPI0017D76097
MVVLGGTSMNYSSLFSRFSRDPMALGVLALAASAFGGSLAACGGSTASVDGAPDPGAPGASSPGASSSAMPGAGAQVTLSLRGTTATVPHADGFSSQTPASQHVAVKSVWLLKSKDDPTPLKLL